MRHFCRALRDVPLRPSLTLRRARLQWLYHSAARLGSARLSKRPLTTSDICGAAPKLSEYLWWPPECGYGADDRSVPRLSRQFPVHPGGSSSIPALFPGSVQPGRSPSTPATPPPSPCPPSCRPASKMFPGRVDGLPCAPLMVTARLAMVAALGLRGNLRASVAVIAARERENGGGADLRRDRRAGEHGEQLPAGHQGRQ